MTGLAPVPYDSETMRGKRMIAGGRRALRHVLYQAALAAAYHIPVLKSVAQRLNERGKPHKLVIVAVARRLVTITNAILKSGTSWSHSGTLEIKARGLYRQSEPSHAGTKQLDNTIISQRQSPTSFLDFKPNAIG